MLARAPAEMELGNESNFPHKGFIDFITGTRLVSVFKAFAFGGTPRPENNHHCDVFDLKFFTRQKVR